MSIPFGLSALGIVSSLGVDKSTTAKSLFSGDPDLFVVRRDLLLDKDIHVGAVTATLPELPQELLSYRCRNNQLMLAALIQIRDEIELLQNKVDPDRIAIVLGTSTSGIAETEIAFEHYVRSGDWPKNFDYRQHEAGGLAEFTARYLGLSGPAYTIATACSSSAKVFASARRLIASGICDAAIIGGSDSLCQMTVNGFNALEALSLERCVPFSANRAGINIGEGAAAFIMTRDEAGVNLLGVGETTDGYHISAPDPSGDGAVAAMKQALADASLSPEDIAYINLHGTGTVLNDVMEGKAVSSVFPPDTPCSSTKAMTGHMLGAAGAVEAAILWLSLNSGYNPGVLAPHLWDGVQDPEIPVLNLVEPGAEFQMGTKTAMLSNSFAFGGNNASLVLGN
jgi:3-oxoacyl-[acyl-carrier-protein] synthase I